MPALIRDLAELVKSVTFAASAPYTTDQAQAIVLADPGMACGPLIMSIFTDAVLYGAMMGMFSHWRTWLAHEEGLFTKIVVYYTVFFQLVITVFLIAWGLDRYAYGNGNYVRLLYDPTWEGINFILTTLTRTPISTFFAERAWRMTNRNLFLVAILTPLILASMGGAIAAGAIVITTGGQTPIINTAIYIWLGCEMSSDIIITGSLTYCLLTSRTGWKGTDRLVTKLIAIALETQLPPTIMMTMLLVINTTGPSQLVSFFSCAPKFYAMSLFITLSARLALRAQIENSSGPRSADVFSEHRSHGRSHRRIEPQVHVTTETFVHTERGGKTERETSEGKTPAPASSDIDDESTSTPDYGAHESQTRLTIKPGPPATILL